MFLMTPLVLFGLTHVASFRQGLTRRSKTLVSLWISHHMAPLHTWPLITQWSSLVTFPWLLGKAAFLHRLILSHSVDQSKSQGQPRFTRWGIRHHVLIGAVAGRHRDGG